MQRSEMLGLTTASASTFMLPTHTTASRAAVIVSVQAQNRLRVRATRGRIPRRRVCCACEGHASPASLATPHGLSHLSPRWPSRHHVGRAGGGDWDRCRVGGGREDAVARRQRADAVARAECGGWLRLYEKCPVRVGAIRRHEFPTRDIRLPERFPSSLRGASPTMVSDMGRTMAGELRPSHSLLDSHGSLPHNVCPPLPHRTA